MAFILGCLSTAGGACVIIAGLVSQNTQVIMIGGGSLAIGLAIVLAGD